MKAKGQAPSTSFCLLLPFRGTVGKLDRLRLGQVPELP